jgi:hypothetical protein
MDLDTSDGGDNNNLKYPNEPLPPRFDEIGRYLIPNWGELALHSLHFEIPEHILFAYILGNGGLELRADEWRSFLKNCNQSGLMFKSVLLIIFGVALYQLIFQLAGDRLSSYSNGEHP